jgi:histidyl-tRNA synthetase
VKAKFASVRGTLDFDVSESARFSQLMRGARLVLAKFGYQELILPLLEDIELFVKGVGSTSDIVERQMFKIEGKDIVLRPEGTAQVIRYYIQQALYRQSDFHKFFYIGPMFRGERPQKGRLRQFHHVGAEAIGSSSVYLDAEIVMLAMELLDAAGVTGTQLHINTLGCDADKTAFEKFLKEALTSSKEGLCDDCSRRLLKNPLRVIDCKRRQCQKIVASLNIKDSHLCASCKDDFSKLRKILDSLKIDYLWDPSLVRGLDYYTNTVFEITSPALGSQDAIGAGGRYNNLVSYLGGPNIPAIGFALGIERILLALGAPRQKPEIDCFIVATSDALREKCFLMLAELRKLNFTVDCDYKDKSLKGQMRVAQKRGARWVVIAGDQEADRGEVIVKNMLTSQQTMVKTEKLGEMLGERCQSPRLFI